MSKPIENCPQPETPIRERAGPVGEGVCDERKEYPDGSGYLQVAFADGVPELLGRSVRVSPASPAPDKEGM